MNTPALPSVSPTRSPSKASVAPVSPALEQALLDAALVRRFNAGDESAFVEIVTRYRTKLFHIAFSQLKDRTDAEEIAQDTLIRAHRGLVRFRGDCSLSSWLYRIALNLSRNRYWYFYRRRRHAMIPLDQPLGEGGSGTFADLIAGEAADPAREAGHHEFSGLVAHCMEQLSSPQREILTLLNHQNHAYADIAAILGINPGTVKSRIARARACLRVLLAKACPEFRADAGPAAWFEPLRTQRSGALLCA